MKLLDKVKNMFTEEVEEEVQVEQIKPKEQKTKNNIEKINQIKEEQKKEEKKPIFFTDDDFNDMELYQRKEERKSLKEEEVKEEKKPDPVEPPTLPHRKTTPYEEVKPIKKFKPTPIISPVYGVLDKNYHKEDIVDKMDNDYTSVDGLSVDSIRNKAYGTLEDELENTLFGNNSILFNGAEEEKNESVENAEGESADLLDGLSVSEDKDDSVEHMNQDLDDLENITMDIGKELDSLLSKKNSSDEDGEDDLFDLIDNMYEGADENDD